MSNILLFRVVNGLIFMIMSVIIVVGIKKSIGVMLKFFLIFVSRLVIVVVFVFCILGLSRVKMFRVIKIFGIVV